ncbi:MAG: carboxypeptidase-like regulatory domain-containing protein [Cyclobacteriaceae bacterium]|nr:carboxypeptidase-like regulatory domain-containing protein [Cyclobacteriaceae bacterium]MCH8515977.1 carboxypeptidase-like regulatory domain-containing protein [Cyclobacteriaceae bacterium]
MLRIFFVSTILPLFFILSLETLAQERKISIEGWITDIETNENIPYALIYYNNTQVGTRSDSSGYFTIPLPKYPTDIIISAVGYATIALNEDDLQSNDPLKIQLRPLQIAIPEINIVSTRAPEWYQNLEIFKQYFLGSGKNARQTKIVNEKRLIFEYDTLNKQLKAKSYEPLIIKNRRLDYEIAFDLLEFTIDYQNQTNMYFGYAYFKDVGKNNKKGTLKKRNSSYLGSPTHFLMACIEDQLIENNFEVRTLKRIKNPDRISDDEIEKLRKSLLGGADTMRITDLNKTNWVAESKKPKVIDILSKESLTSDDFVHQDERGYYLASDDFLLITYRQNSKETTSLLPIKGKKIYFTADGVFLDPEKLIMEGAFTEYKVADMLPLGFRLENVESN